MKKNLCLLGILILMSLLVGCNSKKTQKDRILKVNDTLYYGTDETGPMGDSECVEGEIISSIEEDSIPTENGSSNFGCIGNSYTSDTGDGFIMVFLEDKKWHCFYTQNKN